MNKHAVTQRVEANLAVSISELKKNPSAVITDAQEAAVAVLNHNKVVAYLIKPEVYSYLLECQEDLKDIGVIMERQNEVGVPVDLDDL